MRPLVPLGLAAALLTSACEAFGAARGLTVAVVLLSGVLAWLAHRGHAHAGGSTGSTGGTSGTDAGTSGSSTAGSGTSGSTGSDTLDSTASGGTGWSGERYQAMKLLYPAWRTIPIHARCSAGSSPNHGISRSIRASEALVRWPTARWS